MSAETSSELTHQDPGILTQATPVLPVEELSYAGAVKNPSGAWLYVRLALITWCLLWGATLVSTWLDLPRFRFEYVTRLLSVSTVLHICGMVCIFVAALSTRRAAHVSVALVVGIGLLAAAIAWAALTMRYARRLNVTLTSLQTLVLPVMALLIQLQARASADPADRRWDVAWPLFLGAQVPGAVGVGMVLLAVLLPSFFSSTGPGFYGTMIVSIVCSLITIGLSLCFWSTALRPAGRLMAIHHTAYIVALLITLGLLALA